MIEEFLNKKPLYYTKFDPLRIINAYLLISNKIKHPKRVHLIGTNGKGSTGRALSHLAYESGLNVAHFSSPHIFNFKERFWINGSFSSRNNLNIAHEKLLNMLGDKVAKTLSYFEYQTLLAFVLYEDVDLQVIEAGLGGEDDATSVVDYDLTIFTPIGLDHCDFLGNSINDVASSKLRAMSRLNILANNSSSVVEIAKTIAENKGSKLYFYSDLIDKYNLDRVEKIAIDNGWANYLVQNITLSTMALDLMDIKYDLNDLNKLELFGRFYRIKSNIIIDVGHNTLAAKAIADTLNKKVDLIFNILSDKNIKEVLTILKPKINRVHILPLDSKRAVDEELLKLVLDDLDLNYSYFNGNIDKNREYLAFGSFYLVEKFLEIIGVDSIETK